jgi:urease accessory protein
MESQEGQEDLESREDCLMKPRMTTLLLGGLFSAGMVLLPAVASAHPGHAFPNEGSFANGVLHPVLGADHLVAMVAVGLWAAYLGGRALVGVPLAFLGMMTVGAVLGYMGVGLPAADQAIAVSLVVVGILICLLARLPTCVAATIIGAFATFHGYAHGSEIPSLAQPLPYGAGFILATAALLALGSGIWLVSRRFIPAYVIRGAGAAVGIFGIVMFAGQFA